MEEPSQSSAVFARWGFPMVQWATAWRLPRAQRKYLRLAFAHRGVSAKTIRRLHVKMLGHVRDVEELSSRSEKGAEGGMYLTGGPRTWA